MLRSDVVRCANGSFIRLQSMPTSAYALKTVFHSSSPCNTEIEPRTPRDGPSSKRAAGAAAPPSRSGRPRAPATRSVGPPSPKCVSTGAAPRVDDRVDHRAEQDVRHELGAARRAVVARDRRGHRPTGSGARRSVAGTTAGAAGTRARDTRARRSCEAPVKGRKEDDRRTVSQRQRKVSGCQSSGSSGVAAGEQRPGASQVGATDASPTTRYLRRSL